MQSESPALDVDQGPRILVVDDNKDAADSLAVLLGLLGHHVQVVYNGLEAVECARSFRPALVIMDINMPVMDGYEAARKIRGAGGRERTFLVALTACTSEDDREAAAQAGFDLHLRKPASAASVIHVVSQALAGGDDPSA
ncbi:response regulator [Aquabacterium sp. A7-Y]|uniref:response regulator n=1 Tax=Aquabacterium sp. A7-Y TaxID=1349605 RepID=UPI00223DBE65|nr:response regulator [Aquabacterium sp. A7-Y]MCW7536711.1 response regulator [Aquabacterium sp. A7-Y]